MAQTKVKLIADGVIVQSNLKTSHGITTADIGENASYLYYTDARVSSYLSTNGYATQTDIVAAITDSAPVTLDTLNELAAALGDDPNFATTTATSLGLKAPLASPSFTGNSTFAGSVGIGGSSTTNYPLTLRSKSGDYTKILDWGTDVGGSWGTMQISMSAPYATELRSGAWNFAQGNVGIGLTPNASYSKLQVKAPASSYGFDLIGRDAGINGESQITFWNSNQTTQLAAIFNTTDNLGFTTGTTERMRIDSSGNVGIGDTSPSTKIDVYQSTVGIGVADFRHVNGNRILINPSYNYYDAYNHIFRGLNGTNTHMTIDLNGNVGIGTTSPSNKIHAVAASAISDESILRLSGGATGFSGANEAGVEHSIIFDACAYSVASGIVQREAAKIAIEKDGSWNEAEGGAGTRASLIFSTNNGTIASPDLSERLRINSTGSIYPPIGPTTGTTYYGYDAGLNVGSNSHNTYYGYYAGRANTGTRNTFIGSQTAYAVTNNVNYSVIIGFNALKTAANTANSNVIIGDNAMSNSSGASNSIVIGQGAALIMTGDNNTVVGYEAYRSGTTGAYNVLIGYQVGYAASQTNAIMIGFRAGYVNTANSNVYIGGEAGRNNTSGGSNVFIGQDAGYANTTGASNTYVGTQSGIYQTGLYNTALGASALFGSSGSSNASYNTVIGYDAGNDITTGASNTFLGTFAGNSITTGADNIAIGKESMAAAGTGVIRNIGIGYLSLRLALGNNNIAIGHLASYGGGTSTTSNNVVIGGQAGQQRTAGADNVIIGVGASFGPGTGANNVVIGKDSGSVLTSGAGNTAVGKSSGAKITSGTSHTCIGETAGDELTTGTNCIAIGFAAGSGSSPRQMTTNSNEIVIGSNAIVGAYIKVAWTTGSDKRDKINFSNVPHGLDFVNKLKPTSYSLRKERDSDEIIGKRKYGFLAQEILELEGENPVIIDNSDENKLALQDSNLIPILVNAIQELKAEIETLKTQING